MPAPIAIRLHPNDNVVVARMDILPNTKVEGEVAAATRVPPGHKILTRAVKKGEPLRKYNQIIGFATEDMTPGTHIHTHNCVMGDFERDYAFCVDAHATDYITPSMLRCSARSGSSLAAIMRLVAAEQFTVVTMPM